MENWSEILQALLVTVINVLLPVALAYAIAWFKAQYQLTRAKLPAEQLVFIDMLISQFVVAAEQSGLTGAIANEGEAKKQWVILRMQEALAKNGIKLDLNELSDLIEAKVYEAFSQYKQLPE